MRGCWNFNRLKAEETERQRLFALMMDNMTGKETAVLIIDPICMMAHIRLFHLYIWPLSGLVVAG